MLSFQKLGVYLGHVDDPTYARSMDLLERAVSMLTRMVQLA